MSTLYRAVILFGNRDEDRSEVSFIWGRVLTDKPLNAEGKPVKNPGSVMIYSSKDIKQGDCEEVVLISRGIGGLYDLIPADKVELVLAKMKKTVEQLPEVPLVESTSNAGSDRAEARKRSSESRAARRQARTGAIAATPEMVEAEQPD